VATQIVSTGTLGLVSPLSLPDGSPINYNGGDVQHLGPSSPLDAPAISNVTRMLAYRDALLSAKLNELIAVVNNKEQLMNLPAIWTALGPGESVVATNYRIPPGFEARLIDSTVSSTPVTQQVLLEVLYNANTFGQTTGSVTAVSTYKESGAGTSFYGTGEFVVQLTNTGVTPTEVVASIMMTVRPTTAQTGSVIGPGVQGSQGAPGPQGPQGVGVVGPPGAPGLAGLNWRGAYSNTSIYAVNDGVSHDWDGTIGLVSYINILPCTGVVPPLPANAPSTNWDVLAAAAQGVQGEVGATGTQGFIYMGYFAAGTQYPYGAVVLNGTGTTQTMVYYNDVGATYNAPPSAPWLPLFGPFTGPCYVQSSVPVAVAPQASFVADPTTAQPGYDIIVVGTIWNFPFVESVIFGGPPAQPYSSMNWLRGRAGLVFYGDLQINLPTLANSARANWTVADTVIEASTHGNPLFGLTTVPLVSVVPMGGTAWNVTSWGTNQVEIVITGDKPANAIS